MKQGANHISALAIVLFSSDVVISQQFISFLGGFLQVERPLALAKTKE